MAEVIGPLVKAQLEALVTGAGPDALFSQLDELAKTAARPLTVRWVIRVSGLRATSSAFGDPPRGGRFA